MSVIVGLQDEVIPPKLAHQLPWWENRLGGYPTWMSKGRPLAETLRCKICGLQLALVVQINAPSTDSENEQRILYLYCCTKWACTNEAGGWCVLRGVRANSNSTTAQQTNKATDEKSGLNLITPGQNSRVTNKSDQTTATYKSALSAQTDDDWGVEADDWGVTADAADVDAEAEAWSADDNEGSEEVSMAELAELLSKRDAQIQALPKNILDKITVTKPQVDSKEVDTNLRDAMAQLNVDDDSQGSSDNKQNGTADIAFQGYYIWASAEPESLKASKHEMKLLKQYEQENGKATFDTHGEEWQSEKYESVGGNPDAKAFYRFVKRLEREPNQVLRYAYAGEALDTKATLPKVAACEHCGAPRFFEMQCFPKLLTCVAIDEGSKDAESGAVRGCESDLDWATVAIYSCSRNCSKPTAREKVNGMDANDPAYLYRTEYIQVQVDPDLALLRERLGRR